MKNLKKMIEWFMNLGTFFKLIFFKGDKVLLLLSPQYVNYGDHAIAYSSLMYLKKNFPDRRVFEISVNFYENWKQFLQSHISDNDILIISGGGFLGDIWPVFQKYTEEILATYPENHIVIFPQTIFFQDKKIMSQSKKYFLEHKHLYICLREKNSYEFVTGQWLPEKKENIYLVPDMVLGLDFPKDRMSNKEVVLCFRNDRERVLDDITKERIQKFLDKNGYHTKTISMTREHCEFPVYARKIFLNRKLSQYRKAGLVITDRLHGMIFAIITSTPCLAFDNSSHKVRGVFNQLHDIDYVQFAEKNELEQQLEYLTNISNVEYSIKNFEEDSKPLWDLLKRIHERRTTNDD